MVGGLDMVDGEETAAPEKTDAEKAIEFLDKQLAGGEPSAFEEDLRSEGVDVVRHEKPETEEAEEPAETVEDDGLDELAEALTAPEADPRLVWRDQAIRDAVEHGGMDEDSARVYVNSAKKTVVERQLDAWKSTPKTPQLAQPPSGQGEDPLSASESDDDFAATSTGQEANRGRTGTRESAELEAVRAEVQQLRQALLADKVAAHRGALAEAGKELRAEFPRIVTDEGRLNEKVKATAMALHQMDAYRSVPVNALLRAAAAATFSTPDAGADSPASSRPRTPVVDTPQAIGRPTTRDEWADAFHRIRSKHGDPGNLTPDQQEKAQKEIDAFVRRHR